MLKLKKYTFFGIGRFVSEQSVDLDLLGHLSKIDGENTNTGGSSGSGKSTTVEALAYLLGISEMPATSLQSRITKDPIFVKGWFEGDIVITRSKKDGLTIETPTETVSGNSKLAEEKLDEIIGIKRSLLKTMCYKRQKQGGFFLNLTPKQSHEFLVDCLDLQIYQSKILKIEENIKQKLRPSELSLLNEIERIKSVTQAIQQQISEIEIPVKEPCSIDNIEEAENKKIKMENQLSLLRKTLDSELQELDQFHKPFKKTPVLDTAILSKTKELEELKKQIEIKRQANSLEKQEKIKKISQTIYTVQSKIEEINKLDFFKKQENAHLLKKQEELSHLNLNNCPTCMQKWETEGLLNKKNSLACEIQGHISKLAEIEKEQNSKTAFESALIKLKAQLVEAEQMVVNKEEDAQLQQIHQELSSLKDSIEKEKLQTDLFYQSELNLFQEKKKNTEDKYKNDIESLKNNILQISHLIEKEKQSIAYYQKALDSYNKTLDLNQKAVEKNAQDLLNKENELKEVSYKIKTSEEAVRFIKLFTLQKFQDTLDHIGNRATELINNIPNMANAVIYFENAKETKDGVLKNEVSAVINLEGDESVPVKTLSGGERTAADFAVDLAVSEMIEHMTQKGVNFLIIDEGFDGLDAISKIQCLEILKNMNTSKKILIIDHSSEVKEMVSDTITVSRIKEESFVRQ
jgi:DNA repair exonuclease SbcCD ATPase subunit